MNRRTARVAAQVASQGGFGAEPAARKPQKCELHIRPIGLREANEFVDLHHRHHGPTRGHKFSVCAVDADGQVRGVAIAGRPVARLLDDGAHLEVLRVCTDGTTNACSLPADF